MYINRPEYLEYINVAVELSSILPPYSSKYSKKDFTQQQLMSMLILKQKSTMSYYCIIVFEINLRHITI